MICPKCGRTYEGYHFNDDLCQTCHKYYKAGGTDNPLPKIGKVEHDNRGYVVCHICGRAYKRLGSHIKESHNISIAEYKEKFGLCASARTTERNYSEHMHALAYKYDMPKRLQVTGISTRFKKGDKIRLGKITRLQESLMKKARIRKGDNII